MSTTFDSTASSSSSAPVSALYPNPATAAQPDEFNTLTVEDFQTLEPSMRESATKVYQLAFKEPPYCELFSEAEVRGIFEILSKKGDLVLGTLGDRVISLAGGSVLSDGTTYNVDELAVVPSEQKKGFGSRTFKALLAVVDSKYPHITKKELRTSVQDDPNAPAIEKLRTLLQ